MASNTLDELARLIGRPGALAIASLYGGQRVHFGAEARRDSALHALIGALAVSRLADHYGNELVTVPLPPLAAARRVAARELRSKGHNAREIAAALGISERQAWRAIAEDAPA